MIFSLLTAIIAVVLGTAVWKLHPVPVLLLSAFLFGTLTGMPWEQILMALNEGFGNTQKSIGLIILCGTVIGTFMEKRGAFYLLATKITALIGTRRLPLAMNLTGLLVSCAVFCDSAYVILIGLWKKMSAIYRIPAAVGALSLAMGLYASHCFIPPMPGPLAAVGLLGADVGMVLIFGLVCAVSAALCGHLFAYRAGAGETLGTESSANAGSPASAAETTVPKSTFAALLPLALPLLLIAGSSTAPLWCEGRLLAGLRFLGNPLTALFFGVLLAYFTLGKWKLEELKVDGLLGEALIRAANILIITGAGGAFGQVLQKADLVSGLPLDRLGTGPWMILFPILLAAVLKTAHGSSTIAIITAAGIMAPLLPALHWEAPAWRALVCCAVCCGSLMLSHTNDSYFWVVTKFSGMNVRQGLKLQTLGSLIAGISSAIAILILAHLIAL